MKSILLALEALVLLTIGMPAVAAAWPVKPVRVIVPWGAGGTTDAVSRLVAMDLTKRFGQQVVIDNRAGAGGILGMLLAEQRIHRRGFSSSTRACPSKRSRT